MSGYHEDANDVIGPRRYRLPTREAVKKFRSSKPWRGTFLERKAKFDALLADLCAAYRITCRLEVDPDAITNANSYDSHYANGVIYLTKFSVVTVLHEFAHALGKDETGACDWAINIFRIMFPNSFQRCRFDGHLVLSVRPARWRPSLVQTAGAGMAAGVTAQATAPALPPSLAIKPGELASDFLSRLVLLAASHAAKPTAPVQALLPVEPVQTPELFPRLPLVCEPLGEPVVQPVGDELEVACECLSALVVALRQTESDSETRVKVKQAMVNATALEVELRDLGSVLR